MPEHRRRRRQAVQDDEDEDMEQQQPQSPADAGHYDEDDDGGGEYDGDGDAQMGGLGHRDERSQMVKNLVRYALACEYSRTPIRRDGIRDKVLGANGREFKKVFAGAQKQLRATFGMEMVELPTKDRNLMTTEQRRKAAKSQSQKETSSNTFVLVSLLPEEYSTPEILVPSKVHSADGEASYMALYTTIIAIITLSGGELSDPRLRRHLTRLNAADNMPSLNPNDGSSPTEKTDTVLQKMIKQGYLIKVSEARAAGDEDSTIWHVGPRGKVEVDKEVLAAFVRTIYGGSNPELEQKLQVSLKIRAREPGLPEVVEDEAEEAPPAGDPRPSTRRRGRRRQTEAEEENSE